MPDAPAPHSEPTAWQGRLVERWGDVAHAPIGWWNSLEDTERDGVGPGRLDELCGELQLVPLIVESTGRSAEDVLAERVARARLPRPDRLLAWLGCL